MTVLAARAAPAVSDVVAERQRHLGRERTLKAIAALMGLSSIAGLLSGVVTLVLYFAGSFEFEEYALPTFVYGQVLSAVMLWGSWRLWRLDRWGRLAIGLWAASLTLTSLTVVWTVVGTARGAAAVAPTENESLAAFVGNLILTMAIGFGLLAAYLWWLTFARKTRRVVSPQYQAEVIAETPQISNRLATTTIVALVILAVFTLFSVVAPVFGVFKPAA
ncbi:hypothetical protein [Botrimarina mediterranea]|uniref:Uncharacterized protein n=1 Tax=Botrimarina mediterranea TaxID=2528022 RepID=A0A518KCJ1_9BACT|nr:hypothetical protein [Botrimarina mediterranea]QDV75507.1 hypothetical protein Spa11_37250 [Botrimarina mediterranea]QDV80140.1 hypothetical protein K2D_37640 [Planctomycetes bacterium K2D]